MAASRARVAASSARHCTAMAPCPAWGSTSSGIEDVGEAVHPAQTLHGRHRHHHGGDRAVLAPGDPALHVPPDLGEAQVRAAVGQLRPAPGRAGGDEAARREVGQGASRPARRGDRPAAGRRRARVRAPWSTSCPWPSARPHRPARRPPPPRPRSRRRPGRRSDRAVPRGRRPRVRTTTTSTSRPGCAARSASADQVGLAQRQR